MKRFDHVLLASDFDNTLVDTQGAIDAGIDIPPLCARNRAALEYFIENGGLFSVSTGRALAAFRTYAAGLPLNAPCVIANGAALYDFGAERYLRTRFFTDEIYACMDDILARFPGVGFEVYHDDRRIHAMHVNDYIRSHQHLTRAPAQVVDEFRAVELPIVKVLFEEDTPYLETVRDYILSRPWSAGYETVFSSPHLLELTVRGATKGAMVLELASLLGVARGDLYCIGDHGNDLPMLAVSAIPFAPANCIPAVRESGATIVCSAADGAIADVVERLDARYAERR